MWLVYLDQCVISRFLNREENALWRELRDIVLSGNDKHRILCPTSLEHLVETAPLPITDGAFLDDLMRRISFWWALSIESVLIAQQIACKVRRREVSRGHFLEKRVLRPITYPGTLDELRRLKSELDKINSWTVEGVNELNSLTRGGKRAESDTIKVITKLLIERRVDRLRTELANSLLSGHVVLRAEKHCDKVMDWASKTVYDLIARFRFSTNEAKVLDNLLREEAFDFIPTLKIKAQLQAVQFFRQEKIEPRDQYDITRASCALPYADIFVTDGGKASALRELGLDTVYGTEVFSMKKAELGALTDRLRELVG